MFFGRSSARRALSFRLTIGRKRFVNDSFFDDPQTLEKYLRFAVISALNSTTELHKNWRWIRMHSNGFEQKRGLICIIAQMRAEQDKQSL